MFENRVAKSFTTRRNLLRGAFPAAHDFLVELEERSPPVIWLNAAKNAQVYWQDSFLCAVTFVGVGEANTGIRFSPDGGKLIDETHDRSALLFDKGLLELVERHGGLRNRWATLRDDGEIELRHPAPGAFFRDVMALFQTTGARDRAERLSAALESELAGSSHEGMATTSAPGAEQRLASLAASATAVADVGATSAVAAAADAPAVATVASDAPPAAQVPTPATAPSGAPAEAAATTTSAAPTTTAPAAPPVATPSPTAVANHKTGPAPRPHEAQRPRPLHRNETHRIIGFEHLVDAYVTLAGREAGGGEAAAVARRRVEDLEQIFLCRLPRPDEIRGPRTADRAQVIELAWRCLRLAASIESPFLEPPRAPKDTMIVELWEDHGEALGTPIEALRRACRETVKSALVTLFPGIEETLVSEAELETLRP